MVSFSGVAKTPDTYDDTCYKDTLSLATEENKKVMTSFSNSLATDTQSNFAKGLKAAFTYFRNSVTSINGEERCKYTIDRSFIQPKQSYFLFIMNSICFYFYVLI